MGAAVRKPRERRITLALVCLLAVLVHLPGLGGPFQFDDHAMVAIDPGARSLAAWYDALGSHLRPVLKGSFALTAIPGRWLGGLQRGHRIGNLVIHIAATIAFLGLALRASALLEPWRSDDARQTQALIAAAVFALHPLSSEAVDYISGRSVGLATLAMLLALAAWLRAYHDGGAARVAWMLIGTVAWLAACGSREIAILAPVMVLLFAWLHLPSDGVRTRALGILAMGTIIAFTLFVVWIWHHPRYGPLLALSGRIVEARIGETVLATALAYLGCVALLVCRPDIDPSPAPLSWPQAAVLLGALVVVGYMALRARSRHPMMLVALVWAALWLLPAYVLPLRQDPVSERHAYPAVWSLGWLVGVVVLAVRDRFPLRRYPAGRALVVAFFLLLAGLSTLRSHEYRSEVSLWEASARNSPTKLRVLNNLGVGYIETGRWEDAERVLRAARAIAPNDDRVRLNLERAERRSPD